MQLPAKYHNPLSTNPTKWPNTLKTICQQIAKELFDHFVKMVLKGL